jgi:hypothetical protein
MRASANRLVSAENEAMAANSTTGTSNRAPVWTEASAANVVPALCEVQPISPAQSELINSQARARQRLAGRCAAGIRQTTAMMVSAAKLRIVAGNICAASGQASRMLAAISSAPKTPIADPAVRVADNSGRLARCQSNKPVARCGAATRTASGARRCSVS